MIQTSKKIRVTIIAISVWTVIQTIFHAFWVVYCYLLTICKIRPKYFDVLFVYLTYFYSETCGALELNHDAYFFNSTTPDDDTGEFDYFNSTTSEALYSFLKTMLEKGYLPEESSRISRTEMYLYLFLYTDVVWVLSSACLCFGAFLKHKQKFMSVIFYGPWMVVCIFVNFLDVVASVHFGLDILYLRSYTSWLKFIGVSNYHDFEKYNDHLSSKFIPAMPSTLVVSLLARVFFVWLINVICFFIILFLAIPDICFKDVLKPARPKSRGSKLGLNTGENLDLNSSEARIRNWQLFYGAIEANSTMASNVPSISGTMSNTYDTSTSHTEENRERNKRPIEFLYNTQIKKRPSMEEPIQTDSGFRRYSNVDQDISEDNPRGNTDFQSLRGQMPWSYLACEEYCVPKHQDINFIQKSVQIRDSTTEIQPRDNKVVRPQDFAVFLWLYTILSALWIAASIDQYAAVTQKKKRQRFDLFVLGIIVLITSVIDVVLVSLLARDLNACPFDLTNAADTVASSGTAVDCQLANGIVMTIAARGYVLWIINVVLAITMIKFGAKVLQKPPLLTYGNNTIPRARVPEARKLPSPVNNVYFGDSDLFSNSTAQQSGHRNRNSTPAALTNKNQNMYF